MTTAAGPGGSRRAQNKAKHWNAKQASATTPADRAAVWFDACRTLAAQAEKQGSVELFRKLEAQLHQFFLDHAG
ncbi:hypothetical protein ACIF6L_34285 [Kitasatospora sp. NPDC086009]|uniref:hypothetical protein n=1 Tax=unclassified Kitasatospora TaxID=2633591 RepID=UPI0037C9B973